jgi:WD40 repeat protein
MMGSVAFAPDGKTLAIGRTFHIELYDVSARKSLRMLLAGSKHVLALAFSPDGKRLATGTYGLIVSVWDTTRWHQLFVKSGHCHGIGDLAFSQEGRTAFSLGWDHTLRQWDLTRPGENRILRHFEKPRAPIGCSPDGKLVAVAYELGPTVVWDTVQSREWVTIPVNPSSLAMSPDGKTLALCSPDGTVILWDMRKKKEVHRFATIGEPSVALVFSTGGKYLAVAGCQKICKVWNVVSGAEAHSWNDPPMFAVAFSPNGKWLATGHGDGTISLWDLSTAKKKRTLRGHTAQLWSLKFTPDSKTLVSSALDGTIRLWNPEWERAREVIPLGPADRALKIDLDPSGQYLIAAGHSPLIFVMRLPRRDAEK